jgi:hypothetical protein
MKHSQEEKTTSIATIAIGAALALLGAVTIPLQQEAVAQQQNKPQRRQLSQ